MAARITPSRGGKPDKLMRAAIAVALHEEVNVKADPSKGIKAQKIRKLRLVATALVNAAIGGDIQAIKEINDRMDGRSPTTIRGEGEGGAIPIDIRNLTAGQLEQLKERLIADLVAKGLIGPSTARSRK